MKLKKQFDRQFKVLSLDGGGIKGIIFLIFLKELEMALGKKCCEIFDLIIGTSTGGIAGAMLACGYPAKFILDIYLNEAEMIFKKRFLGGIFGTKYDRTFLDNLCDNYLKVKMKDTECQFITTAVNMEDTKYTHFFKSYKKKYRNKYVSEMVKRTFSAPYYFGYYSDKDGVWSDGGVGLQTSTLIESHIETLRQKEKEYFILNCGCGYQDLKQIPKKNIISQLIDFIPIAREQSIWRQILIAKEYMINFYTANILIAKKHNKMDGIKYIKQFCDYGYAMSEKNLFNIIE